MRSIRFQPQAERDLEEIQDYIAADNPIAALAFVGTLETECESLRFTPLRGRSCPEIRAGLRCIVVGNYKIFYNVTDDQVVIVRIIHGRRDIKRQF